MYKRLVTDYLEETAKRFPNKVAFADEKSSITWSELLDTAKRWSIIIRENFPLETAVPVMTIKSVDAIKIFFTIIYAGGFYSYFENTLPESRLQSMLETLGAETIIIEKRFQKKLDSFEKPVRYLCIEDFPGMIGDRERDFFNKYEKILTKGMIDTDLVYANFTSGSTGTPKAVVVNHRSIVDFIVPFTDITGITSEDVLANQAPFDFDVSIKDIFSAVFTGATCQLVPKAYFSMPSKLLDFLVERKVTSICWAVSAVCIISMLKGFDYKVPKDIKKVMFSGEVMPPKQLAIWRENLPDATYINLYGPTEITCNCTYHIINSDDDPSVPPPIGNEFPNERVFLLDEDDRLIEWTSKSKTGEICVTGTCVTDGYYNSERTKEVFVQNPIQKARLERVYRTGDLGHYDRGGILFYDGRRDTQIKHMGHRIELGEIDTQLGKHPDIERAVSIFFDDKIIAFYLSDKEIPSKDLVNLIKKDLPQFMVPSTFKKIDTLPLTKNGKVDRRALEDLAKATA